MCFGLLLFLGRFCLSLFSCLTWLPDSVVRHCERFALVLFLMLGGGIVGLLVFGMLVIEVVVVRYFARYCLLLLHSIVLEVAVFSI